MEKNIQTGKRIQSRREELGMNLGDIAKEVGVAVSTIQRYEKGKIEKMKLPVIEAIAESSSGRSCMAAMSDRSDESPPSFFNR